MPGSTMIPNQMSQLREKLGDHFNQEELQKLCFDLGVLYDALAGQTISAKAQSVKNSSNETWNKVNEQLQPSNS